MRCKVAKMFTVKCGEEARGNLVNRCITEKSSGNFVTNIWKVSSTASSSSLLCSIFSLSEIWEAPCERVDSVFLTQWRIWYSWWTKYKEHAPHSAIMAKRALCPLSGMPFPPSLSLEDRSLSLSLSWSKSFHDLEWIIIVNM